MTRDPWVLVVLGFLGLLAAGLLAAVLQGIGTGLRALSAPAVPADRPWLGVETWRKREIVHGSRFHGLALVLAYVFFGGPMVAFVWAAIDPPEGAAGHWLEGIMWSAVIAFVLCGLTYWWLQHLRYGDSVCRLLTLPGVLGGWFKADVECALPRDPEEPVIVRLKVVDLGVKNAPEIWRIEHRLTVPVTTGGRSIVPVRLRVPRQAPMLLSAAEFDEYLSVGRCAWLLEIEKKAAGVDFFATFRVPVYDTQNAPPSEQMAD